MSKFQICRNLHAFATKSVFPEFHKIIIFFQVWFKHLFAPTSQSSMSKHLRFLESLGKNKGKKWSQIWHFVLIKGVKLPAKKSIFVVRRILPYQADLFGIGATIRIGREMLCLPYAWFFAMNFSFTYPRGVLCRWKFLIHTNVQVVATIQNYQWTHGTHCGQCTKYKECTGTM